MRRVLCALALLATCTYVLSTLSFRQAQASRNASGTYSTPNTFVTGTTISSTNVNANFSDLASEMTDSLDRSGKGGMLAALRGIDGTVAAPAFSYTSETGSGQYRIGSGDLGWAISGSKKLELTTSLLTVVPDASLFGTTVKWRLDGSTIGGGLAGLYAGAGAASPTTTNYILAADGAGNTSLNSATTINLNVAGSSIGTVTSTGLATASGKTVVATGGLTVGSSGTAISGSFRGTLAVSGGAEAAGGSTSDTVTVTGATAGAECAMSVTTALPTGVFTYCSVVNANQCIIKSYNATAAGVTLPANTLGCRVFNP